MKKITFLFLFVASTLCAQETLTDVNFSTFTNGALVGQNNWVQFNTPTSAPLTVTSGKVVWPGGSVVDDQDAIIPFSTVVAQPTTGITTINFDLAVAISATGASPSYFAALNNLNTTVTTNNFANARIAAKTLDDGFVFGGRVTGQSGYPFAYGTTKLVFNTQYAVRAVLKMVAGNANDTLKLYVGNDFSNLSLYSTCAYTTGTVADPTLGAVLVSQFGSATVNESGVSIASIKVTNLGTVVAGLANLSSMNFKAIVSGKNLIINDVANGSIVDIYSSVGAKVQSAKLQNNAIQLNNLSKGLYVVRVGNLTSKIMM